MDHQDEPPVFDWEEGRRLAQAIAHDAPRIRAKLLTAHQVDMMKLLGADPDRAERTTVALARNNVHGADRDPDTIHIVEHDCPVVDWRGMRKIVLPNGDVQTRTAE